MHGVHRQLLNLDFSNQCLVRSKQASLRRLQFAPENTLDEFIIDKALTEADNSSKVGISTGIHPLATIVGAEGIPGDEPVSHYLSDRDRISLSSPRMSRDFAVLTERSSVLAQSSTDRRTLQTAS